LGWFYATSLECRFVNLSKFLDDQTSTYSFFLWQTQYITGTWKWTENIEDHNYVITLYTHVLHQH